MASGWVGLAHRAPAAILCFVGVACGSNPTPEADRGNAADTIDAKTVTRIAEAQATTLADARRSAIFDAVTAAAEREATQGDWLERAAERAALARSLLTTFRDEARRAGPPTDAEVSRITEERWWELDRPELRRTTHAVVRVTPKTDAAQARSVAEEIRRAVSGAVDAADFLERAKAAPIPPGIQARVEHLEPTDRQGRVLDPKSPPASTEETVRYAEDYSRAVFDLSETGAISPVVRTQFGYHVIHLDERIEAREIPIEERRNRLVEEVWSRRARALHESFLAEARERTPITIERSATALTEKVRVFP